MAVVKIAPKLGHIGGRGMNELREIEHEREALYSIPSWEWDEELDKAISSLARRKLEILCGKEVTE